MIIKCTKCGGALVYDVSLKKMKCTYCDSETHVRDLTPHTTPIESEMLDCNVYACSACGAELSVTDTECTSYCAYCGQPAIIFNRVSKMMKPSKIIPFKVTKEEALATIRQTFKQRLFISGDVKNFEAERIIGIYLPFWVYDVSYSDSQILRGNVKKQTEHFARSATANLKKLPLDASSNLNIQSAQCLEPFDLSKWRDFDPAYLSGFHADCYDESHIDLIDRLQKRCKELFDPESINSVDASSVKIISSKPLMKIEKQHYTLLPAWFMTIRYKEKPYTMMVNGQTGKIMGKVPYAKWKIGLIFTALTTLFLSFVPKLSYYLLEMAQKSDGYLGMMAAPALILAIIVTFSMAISSHSEILNNIKRTSDPKLIDFTKDRSEEN